MGRIRGLAQIPVEPQTLVEQTISRTSFESLPNDAGAHYPVAGAYAMILNNIIRATEDVDILIEDSPENFRKVIDGLSGLVDGAAKEPVPEDFLENIVVKTAVVDGISIPYLSLPDLIRNKLTYRDQDRVDVERLRRLLP